MSTAEVLESNTEFADWSIPLLKEYSVKLAEITIAARNVWQASVGLDKKSPLRQIHVAEADRLLRTQKNLAPAVKDLIRRVSQTLAHANLEQSRFAELRLRLAELENELEAARVMADKAKVGVLNS